MVQTPQVVASRGLVDVPAGARPLPGDRIPVAYVRDVAAWLVQMIEARRTGIYDVKGPDEPRTMEQLLEASRTLSGAHGHLTWVSRDFLLEALPDAAERWTALPLRVPDQQSPNCRGLLCLNPRRASAAGLAFRPLEGTVRDVLAWDATRPEMTGRPVALAPEREWAILAAWHGHPRAGPGHPAG